MLSKLFLSTYLAALTPISIDRSDTDLVPGLMYLTGVDATLSAQEVITQLDQFSALPEGNPNFGLHTGVLWLAAEVRGNNPLQKYVIGFDYPHLDFVDFYSFDQKSRPRFESAGPQVVSQLANSALCESGPTPVVYARWWRLSKRRKPSSWSGSLRHPRAAPRSSP